MLLSCTLTNYSTLVLFPSVPVQARSWSGWGSEPSCSLEATVILPFCTSTGALLLTWGFSIPSQNAGMADVSEQCPLTTGAANVLGTRCKRGGSRRKGWQWKKEGEECCSSKSDLIICLWCPSLAMLSPCWEHQGVTSKQDLATVYPCNVGTNLWPGSEFLRSQFMPAANSWLLPSIRPLSLSLRPWMTTLRIHFIFTTWTLLLKWLRTLCFKVRTIRQC